LTTDALTGDIRAYDLISGAEVEAALDKVFEVVWNAWTWNPDAFAVWADGARRRFDKYSHWVEVDRDSYMVYLKDGPVTVDEFLVTIGLDATPTNKGAFSVYAKLSADDMAGSDYYLTAVPWVCYFDGGIGFHGCYWHSEWGVKRSHGCVNMKTEEAKLLYDFVRVGTYVWVR
jgi:hypothetical protein